KFDLGNEKNLGDGAKKTLAGILGNDTDIAPGNTVHFNIVLNAATANTVKASELALTMAQGADEVLAKKKVVDWKAPVVKLVVTDNKGGKINGKDVVQVSVKN